MQEALQQESKARNVSTGSLPLLLEPPPITVPRLRELEQFAESSKGLAGLDCYEKFSQQQKPAPEAREPDESDLVGRARIAEEVQQDEEDQAKAACLATPYTADVIPSFLLMRSTTEIRMLQMAISDLGVWLLALDLTYVDT